MSKSRWVSVASASALVAGSVFFAPLQSNAATAPTLTPEDGSWVSGVVDVESMPTTRGDQVTSLTLDGEELASNSVQGTSKLHFGVGTNSIEGRYESYFEINGQEDQRVVLDEHQYVDGMFDVPVPNEWLVQGENTVKLQVGTYETSCGTNYDDFEMYDIELETGGPVTPSPDNRVTYNMGDGNCNPNSTLLREFTVSFTVEDDPHASTGLEANFDSSTLADGEHELVATTAQGGTIAHTLLVNNGDAAAPQLNIADGDVLSGDVLVYAIPTDNSADVAEYQVDGVAVESQTSGGDGEAAFEFYIGSNSSEARYGNTVYVNGQPIPLTDRDYVSEAVRVDFPAAYLTEGRNEVKMVTGTVNSGCGVNHDDFVMSELGLDLPNGTATGVDLQDSYNMGDGSCGTNDSKLREATFEFDVEITEGGLSALIDTTQYTDGSHTITVKTVDGDTLTRNVIIDNNGPALTSSNPADGDHLSQATTLQAEFEDISGVQDESTTVTLDGQPINIGDQIGPGLEQGEHLLVFTAVDELGHESTTTVTFTSDAIPGGTLVTEHEQQDDSTYNLSGTVVEDSNANYDTTFYLAKVHSPSSGTEGTSVEIPTELNPASEGSVDLDAVKASDDVTHRSPQALNTSWQRFDVTVGDDVPQDAQVQWEGVIDPQREAHLLVWNHANGAWDSMVTKRGSAEGDTVLRATVAADQVNEGVVNVMVAATDPFADDFNKEVTGEFQDPADYDFSIAHLTDTQYLAEGAAGDWREDNTDLHPQAERDLWYNAYADVWRWVADNAEERKIAYAAHTGDIIENAIRPFASDEMEAQAIREFEAASDIQQIIDDSGIPNGVLAGNHDNFTGADGDLYNEYFGPDRYEEVSQNWPEHASYGGPWKPGDNENHYDLFSAGGLDFVAVYVSYDVNPEELEWASSIFQQYPDRNGLLFSHAYLTTSSEPNGRNAPYSNAGGREQARLIVEENPNVVMVMSGHHHGVGLNVREDFGQTGNHALEMLADYQFYEMPVTAPELADLKDNYDEDQTLRFGSSFFRLLQFDVDRSELVINSYSPFFDEFGAHEYDLEQRYDGTEDELRVPIQLTSRNTSLSTDSVAVVVPTTTVLGQASADANTAAELLVDFTNVEGLPQEDNVTLAWMAVATNETGGRVASWFNLLTVDLAPEGDDGDEGDEDDGGDDGGPGDGGDEGGDPGDDDTGDGGSDDGGSGDGPGDDGSKPKPGLPKTGS